MNEKEKIRNFIYIDSSYDAMINKNFKKYLIRDELVNNMEKPGTFLINILQNNV